MIVFKTHRSTLSVKCYLATDMTVRRSEVERLARINPNNPWTPVIVLIPVMLGSPQLCSGCEHTRLLTTLAV